MILNKLKSSKSPDRIDSIDLTVDGIKVHVYGVLHGVLGGSNKEYVDIVNATIADSIGTRYCEKSMKLMYDNLDVDLNDWLVFNSKEMFKLTYCALVNPLFWFRISKTIYSERTSKPAFGVNGIYTISDSLSSSHFHLLSPKERRLICGFPEPEEYLTLNILRRNGVLNKKFRFANKDWAWLEQIEPNGCIPLRSIHMLEYALKHAKSNGYDEISLFVGEIHNTDIEWYASIRSDESNWICPYKDEIIEKLNKVIEDSSYLKLLRIKYALISLSAGFLAMFPYVFLLNLLIN